MTWLPFCSSRLPFHLPNIFGKQLHKMAEILVLQAQIRGKNDIHFDFWPYANVIILRELLSCS